MVLVHARVVWLLARVVWVHAHVVWVHSRVVWVHSHVVGLHARVVEVHARMVFSLARVVCRLARVVRMHPRMVRVHALVVGVDPGVRGGDVWMVSFRPRVRLVSPVVCQTFVGPTYYDDAVSGEDRRTFIRLAVCATEGDGPRRRTLTNESPLMAAEMTTATPYEGDGDVPFKTDAGGFAFTCNDIKLSTPTSTWATRISQLARVPGLARIITYSLPNIEYVRMQLARRRNNIWMIANSKFEREAQALKREFPDVRIRVAANAHSKVLLVEPHTIWISSANFGDSGWHDTTIGLHSIQAHDWYVETMFNPLWASGREVNDAST